MKESLSISLIQANLHWEDVDANLNHFDKLISVIKEIDLILLPEMFNTSFCPKSNHLSESMNGKSVSWMKEISKKKKCVIAGSLMINEEGKVYNRLVWISKDGQISIYDKRHLFSLIEEERHISKGDKR